jgi:hypothetical protein
LLGVAAVSVAAVVAVAWPQTQGLVVQVLVSCLAALAAGVAGAALLASYPLVPRARRLREVSTDPDPLGTVRQRRQLELGLEGVADYDRWLRPVLSDVASSLARLQGVDLAAEPVRAQRILGSDVWQLVTPVPPAGASVAPDREELRMVFEKLEQL